MPDTCHRTMQQALLHQEETLRNLIRLGGIILNKNHVLSIIVAIAAPPRNHLHTLHHPKLTSALATYILWLMFMSYGSGTYALRMCLPVCLLCWRRRLGLKAVNVAWCVFSNKLLLPNVWWRRCGGWAYKCPNWLRASPATPRP